MSDQDPAEGEPVEEIEPKIILTQANIEEGLSTLYRIPDGSSFSFSSLTVEEKDPMIQNLTDVNEKSATYNSCALEGYPYIRVLKLNTNAITKIDEVTNLEYLLEMQAKTNQISSIEFMATKDVLNHL